MKIVRIHTLILGALLLLGLPSCRGLVIENRTDCPSFVFFKVQDTNGLPMTKDIWVEVRKTDDGALLASDTVSFKKMDNRSYYLEVKKSTEIVAAGITGLRIAEQDGSKWIVPVGNQWEPVYLFSAEADATGEETYIPVEMKKEHCNITVHFRSDDGTFPYYVVTRSNTCGLDAATRKGVTGLFRYTPSESSDGAFTFMVPRQADYSMVLEMWVKPGALAGETGKVDELLLWSALQRVPGFDWDIDNLPDIDVDIDYARSQVLVTVNDWTEVVELDYTI